MGLDEVPEADDIDNASNCIICLTFALHVGIKLREKDYMTTFVYAFSQ